MYVVVVIIFIVISLVFLISPHTVFTISENIKENSHKGISNSYRLRTRICGGVCLFLGLSLLIIHTLPTKEDLIYTDSTHKTVQYIQIDDTRLGENEKVRLALYDPECSEVEVCIALPKLSDDNQVIKELTIYADDKKVEKYTIVRHTSLWKQYVILLFEDMESWEEMRLERDGYVVEFQSSDIKK